LNASVSARNFEGKENASMRFYYFFFVDTSNSMASTFLGLDRSEKKLLGK
jgi:hypothetical protein